MRKVRARLGALALMPVLALAATACGGDDDAKAATTPPVSAGAGPAGSGGAPANSVPTDEQLAAALPTQAQMPQGWRWVEGTARETATADDPACAALAQAVAPGVGGDGRVAAAGGSALRQDPVTNLPVATMRVHLASYPAGEAGKVIEAARSALPRCGDFTVTDEDGETTRALAWIARGPEVGEDSLALTLTTTYDGDTMYYSQVTVRTGNTLVWITHLDIDAEGPAAPLPDEAFVRTVVSRVEATSRS